MSAISVTIESLSGDAGNCGNFNRLITVEYHGSFFSLTFTEMDSVGSWRKTISRKAAEELMAALDVMLSETEEEVEEEEEFSHIEEAYRAGRLRLLEGNLDLQAASEDDVCLCPDCRYTYG